MALIFSSVSSNESYTCRFRPPKAKRNETGSQRDDHAGKPPWWSGRAVLWAMDVSRTCCCCPALLTACCCGCAAAIMLLACAVPSRQSGAGAGHRQHLVMMGRAGVAATVRATPQRPTRRPRTWWSCSAWSCCWASPCICSAVLQHGCWCVVRGAPGWEIARPEGQVHADARPRRCSSGWSALLLLLQAVELLAVLHAVVAAPIAPTAPMAGWGGTRAR